MVRLFGQQVVRRHPVHARSHAAAVAALLPVAVAGGAARDTEVRDRHGTSCRSSGA